MSTTLLLLAFCLTVSFVAVAASEQGYNEDENQYIFFLKNYSLTHQCCCWNTIDSPEFDYQCELANKTKDNMDCLVPCSQLPGLIIYSLKLDCSRCTECVRVNLLALTKAHNGSKTSNNEIVFPPQSVHLVDCNVDSYNIGILKLLADNVTINTGMEVAPFGSPDIPGVGGYYTVNVTYPPDFEQSNCWLVNLEMQYIKNMWYLPSYVTHKCNGLFNVSISNSPIEWISIGDIFSLHNVKNFTLRHCRLKYFADDALDTAIELLDRYLEAGMQSGCSNINETEAAIRILKWKRDQTGRLSSPTFLYDMMDTSGINFTVLFGYRLKDRTMIDRTNITCDMPYKMSLTNLDLSFNSLTTIPFSISMFDKLNRVNLSNNDIDSLYHGWMCWYPPIPVEKKSSSNRHCYWFRSARSSLKVLDLSFNKISLIGEIQPWHQVALSQLLLQGNKIISVNSDSFTYSTLTTSLLDLNLDENHFSYFLLKSLTRLETLSLKNCSIANVEPESLPQSPTLREVNLDNNRIFAIAPGVFENLTSLEFVRLRYNSLLHFYADSFRMPSRPTLASRVIVHIANQTRIPICDCGHVYKKTLQEEEYGNPQISYIYPRILPEDMNSECKFFQRFNASLVIKPLLKSKQSEFLCEFQDNEKHRLPPQFCNESEALLGRDKCFVSCIYGCRCFHDDDWDISDLDCTPGNSTATSELVKMRFEFPIKYLFMAGLKDSEYFRHISKGSFRWLNQTDAAELLVLQLNNSNVKFVEKDAFNQFPNIVVIYLHDNNISSIDATPFSDNCSFNGKLNQITLHNNSMSYIDPKIINRTCPTSLADISLSQNPWRCSCSPKWIELHQALIDASRSTQVVSDFPKMTCTLEKTVVDACLKNRDTIEWAHDCRYVNKSSSYPMSDDGKLINLCEKIEMMATEKRKRILVIALTSVLGLALLVLIVFAVRRRHRLLAVVRVLILLKYQRDRLQHQQVSRDALPYDAMMWASDRDQDCLVDVLNCVRSASSGDQLELCVPESFLYSDLCSCPLTYFDCPAEGAKFSSKVVVALSERFLDTQYLAMYQVIRELDSVGRNPFKDIVFLRLSSHKVSLQRNRQVGPEDVEAFKTLQRILAGSEIVYKSVDWEYRLIERIRSRDTSPVSTFATSETPIAISSSHGPADQESEDLDDLPGDNQPLVVDVELPTHEIRVDAAIGSIQDWPPFHSDKVSELFILSASESRDQLASASSSVVESIARRLPAVRLGTNDAALAACWPVIFEAATPADRINSFLMKRTRQFVVLLSNGLLSWLRAESELQREFQAFLAANSFRRRLLVILVEPVDSRSRTRYEALANHRLDGGESGSPTNWFDMTTEDIDMERLGSWLDCVLFKRSAST